ncbi:MAG: hypothetical protein SGPRY_013953, partial [Prymnesium sp.]
LSQTTAAWLKLMLDELGEDGPREQKQLALSWIEEQLLATSPHSDASARLREAWSVVDTGIEAVGKIVEECSNAIRLQPGAGVAESVRRASIDDSPYVHGLDCPPRVTPWWPFELVELAAVPRAGKPLQAGPPHMALYRVHRQNTETAPSIASRWSAEGVQAWRCIPLRVEGEVEHTPLLSVSKYVAAQVMVESMAASAANRVLRATIEYRALISQGAHRISELLGKHGGEMSSSSLAQVSCAVALLQVRLQQLTMRFSCEAVDASRQAALLNGELDHQDFKHHLSSHAHKADKIRAAKAKMAEIFSELSDQTLEEAHPAYTAYASLHRDEAVDLYEKLHKNLGIKMELRTPSTEILKVWPVHFHLQRFSSEREERAAFEQALLSTAYRINA